MNKRLTPMQARQAMKIYCSYQERCHSEVKDKLFSSGLNSTESEEVISELVADNFLNEERFAKSFAGGKFRMKKWGRIKIRYELKKKQLSEYCIRKGLSEIDEEEYHKTISKLAEEKLRLLRSERNVYIKKKKVLNYLLQKGFERELVMDEINKHFL